MCRELLSSQAADQLRATTPEGDTALHLATRRRDLDMVRILVDYGTNVDIQNVGIIGDIQSPKYFSYFISVNIDLFIFNCASVTNVLL